MTMNISTRLMLTCCVAAAAPLLLRCNESQSAPSPAVEVRETRAPVEINAAGVLRPEVGAEVKTGPRISGVLRKLYVRVGDMVTKGSPLAELDHADLDADIAAANAEVGRCLADRDYQRALLERRRTLNAAGLVAQEDLDV